MSGTPVNQDYAALLYQLLPAVYRRRDQRADLERFLRVFGEQLAWLRANIDQLHRDQYIDSCQDWVVPYLGDLVAANLVSEEPRLQRADVRNTLGWRRRKGTRGGLEDVVSVSAGPGAHAVEMLERVAWTQHLNHRRPALLGSVPLDDGSRMARLGTAFELEARTVDLAPSRGGRVRHRLRALSCFVAWLRSAPHRGEFPFAVDALRYALHPLGWPVPLFSRGRPARSVPGAATPDNAGAHADHWPIRARDFADHPQAYLNVAEGFTVYEDGVPLCAVAVPAPSAEREPAADYQALFASAGLKVADPGLYAGLTDGFALEAVRLEHTFGPGYSPLVAFASQFALSPDVLGAIDTQSGVYAHGAVPASGSFEPVLLLRIERNGADADFPESELIVTNERGRALLVYLPALVGLPPGQAQYLYVSRDGATYFARNDKGPGVPDRNPDAALLGAFSSALLARAARGQVRARPGVRPWAPRLAVYRDLRCWDAPPAVALAPGEIAFDPESGRFRCRAGEAPAGVLSVDCQRAVPGRIGPQDADTETAVAATLRVAKTLDADHTSVQDALDAAPQNSPVKVVIEIADSATYREALVIDGGQFPAGLELRAARLQTPTIVAPAGPVLQVTAGSNIGRLGLHGLTLAGGMNVAGSVPRLEITRCALAPVQTPLGYQPSIFGELSIERSVVGTITGGLRVAGVRISDATVQHPDAVPERTGGFIAIELLGALTLERVTVLGEVEATSLAASHAILCGAVRVTQPEESCIRHCRVGALSPGVARYRVSDGFPVFLSTRFGDPGYLHLHPNSAPSVTGGSENNGEIGAFCRDDATLRFHQAQSKLDEYAPAGIEAVPVRVAGTSIITRA
jgi:phage tail-like protein